jgi:hypothetical protein
MEMQTLLAVGRAECDAVVHVEAMHTRGLRCKTAIGGPAKSRCREATDLGDHPPMQRPTRRLTHNRAEPTTR